MFLSLALTMILSLVFTLLESARLYGLEAQSKMETELLLESKMAEYDTALLEQYHLYFLEAGRKGEPELSSLEQSLQELGEENLRAKPGFLKMSYTNLYEMQLENCYITNYTMATDDAGAEFRRQAADYVKRTTGIAAIEKLYEKATEAKELTEDNKDIEKKFKAAIQETDTQSGLERNTKRNSANQKNENPLDYVKELKNKSILSLVVEDVSAVSTQTIDLSDDIAKRTCFTGNGEAQQEDMTTGLFFREYLLKQFSDYRNQSESEVLQYEMEYLIAGKDSDVANLAGVAERMLAIREVANYMLGICSIEDIRKKEIQSVRVLCFGIGGILLHLWQRNQSLYSMLGGIAVGAAVIILSLVSGGIIGIGDGLVLCVAGIYIGGINTMRLLLTGLFLSSLYALVLLFMHRKRRKDTIPFIPFLLAAYLILLIL